MFSSVSSSNFANQLLLNSLYGQSAGIFNYFENSDSSPASIYQSLVSGLTEQSSNATPLSALQQFASPSVIERAVKNAAAKSIDLTKILSARAPGISESSSSNFTLAEQSALSSLFNQTNHFLPLNYLDGFAPAALKELARIWGSSQKPGQVVNTSA